MYGPVVPTQLCSHGMKLPHDIYGLMAHTVTGRCRKTGRLQSQKLDLHFFVIELAPPDINAQNCGEYKTQKS